MARDAAGISVTMISPELVGLTDTPGCVNAGRCAVNAGWLGLEEPDRERTAAAS